MCFPFPFQIADLKLKLQNNHLLVSGRKSELVDRCVEAILFGIPPKCPRCNRGQLRYANDGYYCLGYYSESKKAKVDCDYHAKWDEIPTEPWRD